MNGVVDLQRERSLIATLLQDLKVLEIKIKISKNVNQKFVKGIDLISKFKSSKDHHLNLCKDHHLNLKSLEIQKLNLSIHSLFKNKEIEYWGTKLNQKLGEMVDSEKKEFVEIHQKTIHQLDQGLLLKQNYLASAGIRQDDNSVGHLVDNRFGLDDSVGHLVDNRFGLDDSADYVADDGLGLDESTVFFDAHENAVSSPILACSMAKLKALENVKKKITLKNDMICKEKARLDCVDDSFPTISTDLDELVISCLIFLFKQIE
jgi:hypothetical protein